MPSIRDLSPRFDLNIPPLPSAPAVSTVKISGTGTTPIPPTNTLGEIREIVVQACKNDNIGRIERRAISLMPWVFWSASESDSGLLDDQKFSGHLLDMVEQKGGVRCLRNLASALVHFWPYSHPAFGRACNIITHYLDARPRSLHKWQEAHHRFGLFDAENPQEIAPLIAEAAAEQGLSPSSFMIEALGWSHTTLSGRLASEVWRSAFRQRIRYLSGDDALKAKDEIEGWLSNDADWFFGDRSRREWLAAALINGCPKPRLAIIQQWIIGRALEWVGDPRRQPERWTIVNESRDMPTAADTLRRWLSAENFAQFIQIIDETMKSNDSANERRQWRKRKKFWTKYKEKLEERGELFEAWLLLGPKAREIFERTADPDRLKAFTHGTLRSGAQQDHSVLLMRWPGLVISEWSHNGKVRLFQQGVKDTPNIYSSDMEYGDRIRDESASSFIKSYRHNIGKQADWRRDVSVDIKRHLGWSLSSRDYEVR